MSQALATANQTDQKKTTANFSFGGKVQMKSMIRNYFGEL